MIDDRNQLRADKDMAPIQCSSDNNDIFNDHRHEIVAPSYPLRLSMRVKSITTVTVNYISSMEKGNEIWRIK